MKKKKGNKKKVSLVKEIILPIILSCVIGLCLTKMIYGSLCSFSRSVYCSECGKQNYSLAKYCDGCGAKKSDDWEIEVYKRCPKCGKRQSNIVYPDFCPKCGAKLPALRHVKLGER